MLSAILTLMVDSMATSLYTKKCNKGIIIPDQSDCNTPVQGDQEMAAVMDASRFHVHHHQHHGVIKPHGGDGVDSQLLRYRVVAMVRYY